MTKESEKSRFLLLAFKKIILFTFLLQTHLHISFVIENSFGNEIKLYQLYRKVHKNMKAFFSKEIRDFHDKINHDWHIYLDFPDLKALHSFRRKNLFSDISNNSRSNPINILQLSDIVRCTLVFSTYRQLTNFHSYFLSKYGYAIVSVNDALTDKSSRYKAINMKVMNIHQAYLLGISFHMDKCYLHPIIEVQLQLKEHYSVQRMSHDFYKIDRIIDIITRYSNIYSPYGDVLNDYLSPHPYHILIRTLEKYQKKNKNGNYLLSHFDLFTEECEFYFKRAVELFNLYIFVYFQRIQEVISLFNTLQCERFLNSSHLINFQLELDKMLKEIYSIASRNK